MKKQIFAFIAIVVLLSTNVSAHPGRTDSSGGHYNRSTGEYHYHHGYPAHQHTNGICPYSQNNSSNQNSSSDQNSSSGNSDSGSSSNSSNNGNTQNPNSNTTNDSSGSYNKTQSESSSSDKITVKDVMKALGILIVFGPIVFVILINLLGAICDFFRRIR